MYDVTTSNPTKGKPMNTLDSRVYAGYKLALKGLKRSDASYAHDRSREGIRSGKDVRAGDRKQRAREMVVARYGVTHADVKRIVREFSQI